MSRTARHRSKADRRSVPADRARAANREGWEFKSTYSHHPTPDDFDTLSATFGVEPRADLVLRVAGDLTDDYELPAWLR